MVSEITYFQNRNYLLQNSTRLFSSLPNSVHKFFQLEEPSQRHLEEAVCRTKVFQSSFFPCYIKMWNGFNRDLQNIDSYKEFKCKISQFIKIKSNSDILVHDVYGIKLLSRSRHNLSHLHYVKSIPIRSLSVFIPNTGKYGPE